MSSSRETRCIYYSLLPTIYYWGTRRATFPFRRFWWCKRPLRRNYICGAFPTHIQCMRHYIDSRRFCWRNISDCTRTFLSREFCTVLSGLHEATCACSRLLLRPCIEAACDFRPVECWLYCLFWSSSAAFIFFPWIRAGLQNPYEYGNSHIFRNQEVKQIQTKQKLQ